jgi:hypothetical protein
VFSVIGLNVKCWSTTLKQGASGVHEEEQDQELVHDPETGRKRVHEEVHEEGQDQELVNRIIVLYLIITTGMGKYNLSKQEIF